MSSVVLGVTGGIAAYKAADILRRLLSEGAGVTVVMTRNACRFITPLTLATLSGRRVITSAFPREGDSEPADEVDVEHIELARSCSLLLIAPATADIIGKMAAGVADDFLSTFFLAVRSPVLVAPAMNSLMWTNPVVQANVSTLMSRGVRFVGPDEGALAGRKEGDGIGRLSDPALVVQEAMNILAHRELLSGRKVLVTAGPTREALDPVRFISNPSTGKMGYAVAEAARDLGADVVLVSGPTHLPEPHGLTTIRVTSADEMRTAVMGNLDGADIVVKAAAVSDFRPVERVNHKIKKEVADRQIELEPTPDILSEITSEKGRFLVGFAAETEKLAVNARQKLQQKNLDLIVANQVGGENGAFGSDENEVTVLSRDGKQEVWPRMRKAAVASRLMAHVASCLMETG